MRNKIIFMYFFLTTILIFSQDSMVNKYIDEARSAYIIKDYEKAYSRFKFVAKFYDYKESNMSSEVKTLAENIYFEYMKKMFNEKKDDALNAVIRNDQFYPAVERFSGKVKDFRSSIEAERLRKIQEEEITRKFSEEKKRIEDDAKLKKEREEELLKLQKEKEAEFERMKKEKEEIYNLELAKIKKEQEDLLKKRNDEDKIKEEKLQNQINRQLEESRKKEARLEQAREKEKQELQDMQKKMLNDRIEAERKMKEELSGYFEKIITLKDKDTSSSGKTIVVIVTLLIVAFGIIFLIIFGIVLLFIRNSQKQQQKYFDYSVRLLQQQPQTNILSIPLSMPPVDNENMIEENTMKKLPAPIIVSDGNMDKIKKIIEACNTYAVEIDQVTHRKNCAKNVADLIYKISKKLGYNEYDSLVFFAVGLIYDIGFLSIDHKILLKENVSEEEYEEIKTHTSHGLNMIHFIDNDLKSIFIDGISKHHENLDGTGYPGSLKKNDIPYVARVIRVVETFISLISSRKYRKITDKESAIKMLLENKKKYDKKIIDALSSLV